MTLEHPALGEAAKTAEHLPAPTLKCGSAYLKEECGSAWMREVETHDVQKWLEADREEGLGSGAISCSPSQRTPMAHIKHLLSGVFGYAAREGFFNQCESGGAGGDSGIRSQRARREGPTDLEEIDLMLRILPEGSAARVVATAAYTGSAPG